MAIENRNLVRPGTTLIGRHKGAEYRLQVLATEDGTLIYQLPNGQQYTSSSKAATDICGSNRNGWAWWSIADTEGPANPDDVMVKVHEAAALVRSVPKTLKAAREKAPAPTPITEAPSAKKKATAPAGPKMVLCIKRVPNQGGVPEGHIKYFCSCCMKSFLSAERDPQTCPDGHAKRQVDDLAGVDAPKEAVVD